MNLLHYFLSVTFCHLQAAHSSLVVLSLGWLKGSRHYCLIALLGWPLPLRGNSALPVFEFSSAVFSKTPYGAAPKKVLGAVISKILPNGQYFLMHLQEHVSNGSQAIKFLWTFSQEQGLKVSSATPHILLSRNSLFWLQNSYKAYVWCL